MNSLSVISGNFDTTLVFCVIDDLCKYLFVEPHTAGRHRGLSVSEVITICLIRDHFKIEDLKHLYRLLDQKYRYDFPGLPSYANFVATVNSSSWQMLTLVKVLVAINNQSAVTVKIVDSTPLPVCHNMRIYKHKTMKKYATRSKSTMGWFYGLKLHLLIDLQRNILNIQFTTAKASERAVLKAFFMTISNSIVVADAGYISKALEKLAVESGSIFLTSMRKNMKKLTTPAHIALLNLRGRVEGIFSLLKARLGLISSLPRSVGGYFAHCIRVLFIHMFQPITKALVAGY
jgi:hypothetical protein